MTGGTEDDKILERIVFGRVPRVDMSVLQANGLSTTSATMATFDQETTFDVSRNRGTNGVH